MKKIVIVIGTRPNFIKITRFKRLAEELEGVEVKLAHTNQHYDEKMAGVFFNQFDIPIDHFIPHFSGSPNAHFGHIIQGLDAYFTAESPDLVVVVGDVNSTLAGALVANRLGIKLAHLESGLRSRDLEMPEEINRILTDRIADYYFVTEPAGEINLLEEGVSSDKIFYVGNTMIDTLVFFRESIKSSSILETLGVHEEYALVTLHRPSNVDSEADLVKILNFFKEVSQTLKIVFPVHHRTKAKIEQFELTDQFNELDQCVLCDALDYFSFQKLISEATVVITDSGGIQEETTFLQIPCITLRENTERPVTITEGTNILMGFEAKEIVRIVRQRDYKNGRIPKFWDGHASDRIMKVITQQIL